jgi:glycosyltransferase involved in cell wall biosynthesis
VTLSVLQVSTADRGGGAEAVALSLHRALRERGVEASLAVGYRRTDEQGIVEIGPPRGKLRRVLRDPRVALDVMRGREDFRFPASRRVVALAPRQPDVLHLHNLHGGYFDLRVLPELAGRVPTVVTMHDEWLYTGHCGYTLGCDRWLTTCGDCPHLGVYPALRVDGTAGNRRRKGELYGRSRLHVVTPSAWLLERAHRSVLAPAIASTRLIPNGVDLSVFSPGSKDEARARLALPQDALVLVFAAQGVRSNPFKDFGTLRDALRRLDGDAIAITLGEAASPEQIGGIELRSQPFVEAAELADHLRAADLYVLATRADNHPLTVLEALACGAPVVASRAGGIPEQVSEKTGILVEPGDPGALATAIEGLLADPERRARMSAAAAADAGARFSLKRQVDAYLDLYGELAPAA